MDTKLKIFLLFLSFFTFAEAQFPICDPTTIEWFPHPHDCESYIICFHGVQNTFACAPGLHFSPTELRCTVPELALCHVNYLCPPEDDEHNPVFLPDPYNCAVYYICSRGTPIRQECALGTWWDIRNNRCTSANDVVCDNRTVLNPGNPNLSVCLRRADLFHDGNYLKSFCIINETVQYWAADEICRLNRMNLFIIDDADTQYEFRNTVRQVMGNETQNFFWINGNVDARCDNIWYSFIPWPIRLPNFIHWVQEREFVGIHTGPCLRYTQQFSPDYYAMGMDCRESSWMACEFSVPP